MHDAEITKYENGKWGKTKMHQWFSREHGYAHIKLKGLQHLIQVRFIRRINYDLPGLEFYEREQYAFSVKFIGSFENIELVCIDFPREENFGEFYHAHPVEGRYRMMKCGINYGTMCELINENDELFSALDNLAETCFLEYDVTSSDTWEQTKTWKKGR